MMKNFHPAHHIQLRFILPVRNLASQFQPAIPAVFQPLAALSLFFEQLIQLAEMGHHIAQRIAPAGQIGGVIRIHAAFIFFEDQPKIARRFFQCAAGLGQRGKIFRTGK